MFDFGHANIKQKEAIKSAFGPVLIMAGPGTGKTYTLVQRCIYLIQECHIKPENIFIATFTEKAAKELITRISNELIKKNIVANIHEMYIGTFHSLCLRILKDNLEYTRLRRNYRLVDEFDQQYYIFQNIYKFKKQINLEQVLNTKNTWNQANKICKYVNNLSEELVDYADLLTDEDTLIQSLGIILQIYQDLIKKDNIMDFASIQKETFNLLKTNPAILKTLQSKFSHIMVDEYQDTNYIQEQLIFLLGGNDQNICVVGDDDQGLYRFRGATIRNILEFPQKFTNKQCKIITLSINYRSSKEIVNFYNQWMHNTSGTDFSFTWGKFRYDKTIIPYNNNVINSPTVIKITTNNNALNWHNSILNFITDLKSSGKLQDYNQIAFLFKSVKNEQVKQLALFLENHGINVYSPRSDMFFQRDEIKLALGCILLMFPDYINKLEHNQYEHLQPKHVEYYKNCIISTNQYLSKSKNIDLLKWLREKGKSHLTLNGTTDYAYSGLLYQLFQFSPFLNILSIDTKDGIVDTRPLHNIAKLTQIIGKFEFIHKINVLDSSLYKGEKRINRNTELLFNLYLKLLFDGGISEYEDDSEYAPSGCVSFLTIHQSKGMEFPIVFVDSLYNVPRNNNNDLMLKIETKYFKRSPFEPYNKTKFYDFWRLYYTAFSRAQNLLILTCNENKKTPSKYFKKTIEKLPELCNSNFSISEFEFSAIKDVNIKRVYSFTSHITVFDTCSLQYKFYKELEFMPVRANAMLFGRLVHETIEDIHKAAIRHEEKLITKENIIKWFDINYATLSQSEHTYIAEPQKQAALNQILMYAEKQKDNWCYIQQSEFDVSVIKDNYIIEGTIDLIKGDNNTIEIVDFKSERKPDLEKDKEKIERYRKQLHIYAYLVEQKTGQKVSKMHLYYTGENNGIPTISFPYSCIAIENTVNSFDNTVKKIHNKEYKSTATNLKTCSACDFRFYCIKK